VRRSGEKGCPKGNLKRESPEPQRLRKKDNAPKAEEKGKDFKMVGTVWEKEGHVREKDFYEHKFERHRKTIGRRPG
jgi:hypothetical protein